MEKVVFSTIGAEQMASYAPPTKNFNTYFSLNKTKQKVPEILHEPDPPLGLPSQRHGSLTAQV